MNRILDELLHELVIIIFLVYIIIIMQSFIEINRTFVGIAASGGKIWFFLYRNEEKRG
jgi:hypothetical protein